MASKVNLAPNIQLYDFRERVGNSSPLVPRIITATVPTQSHCPFLLQLPGT
ncbi:rCG49390 [Rattus norvegicus]|uniref:RCG49390 n=1 Tax=Rattus norvegicus TaxID=10116 RepID=A6J3I5_RAT|nr:rCG49390 [Rattus norvegicus]